MSAPVADAQFIAFTSDGKQFVSLHIRLSPDRLDDGYVAEVLECPGCMSQGETKREALVNVLSALQEMLS